MKKALSLLAIIAMVCLGSCTKKEQPVAANINANDVTVEEGSTVTIHATTNSTAAITYTCDNTAIATVSAAGEVAGVKAGSANITLKVAAVEGKFTAAEKKIKVTVTAKEVPPAPSVSITIDGKFDDWAALASGTFSQTYGDEDATHPALTHCKVCADAKYIYVYVEWDTDMVDHYPQEWGWDDEAGEEGWVGGEFAPFHCYINTDGNASTGGFDDQFTDACTDILLEGFLYAGGEHGGELGSYAPSIWSWSGEPNGHGWAWDFIGEDEICEGAGVDGKYELLIDRSVLGSVGFPVADTFSIGFDIQQSWDSVGILPTASASEDNPSGTLPSLKVVTQK